MEKPWHDRLCESQCRREEGAPSTYALTKEEMGYSKCKAPQGENRVVFAQCRISGHVLSSADQQVFTSRGRGAYVRTGLYVRTLLPPRRSPGKVAIVDMSAMRREMENLKRLLGSLADVIAAPPESRRHHAADARIDNYHGL